MTKYCQNCNRPNANSAQYCIHCGETFTSENEYPHPLEQDNGAEQVVCIPESGNTATVEFVLGLIGGIAGFILGSLLLLAGIFYTALLKYLVNGHYLSSAGSFSSLGTVVLLLGVGEIIFAIIGISGAVVSPKNPRTGGRLMVVSAVGVLICFPLVSILPFILLLIAGVMTLRGSRAVQSAEGAGEEYLPERDARRRRKKKVRRKSGAGFYAGMIVLAIVAVVGIFLIIIS